MSPLPRRLGASIAMAAMLVQGCYSSVPLYGRQPLVGERVELSLNDSGRAALSSRLGEAVGTVEGTLLDLDAEGYHVAVSGLTQLTGTTARWNGERLTIGRSFTTAVQLRRFDRSKTTMVVAISAAVVILAFLGQSLIGSGSETVDPSTGPPQHTLRSP